MQVIQVQQGTAEWTKARLAIPTASQFARIITATGKPSAQAFKYQCALIAEKVLGYSQEPTSTVYMERGIDLEDEAIAYYELERGVDTQKCGFILNDERNAGCSPDRLVGEDGGLEIKCPAPHTHVAYLLNMAEEYKQQVQASMWICQRAWWDLLSYHPSMPPALVRVHRDEEYIEAMAKHTRAFIVGLNEMMEKVLGAAT